MNKPVATVRNAEFDEFSADYDAMLAEGLAASGETKDYFAKQRVVWMTECLKSLRHGVVDVIDFGCGTGSSAPLLLESLVAATVLGLDVSAKLLNLARESFASNRVRFLTFGEFEPSGSADLVYCNGVFHHIPPTERYARVSYIYKCLRPGGLFSFWENNPWNPGTRYVMSRIPFDRDAITLSPPEGARLLQSAGFENLRTDFLFFFPRTLSWLRGFEPWLKSIPLGGQYQILCRRPLL